MGQLRADKEAAYPKARGVLEGGVYEIPFLESFLSNYPESQQERRGCAGAWGWPTPA